MLFAVGNFGGFVLGMFMTMIVKGDNGMQTLYGLIFCAGIFIIGLVLIILMKEERNRLGAELKQSDLRRSLISSMISEKEEGNQKYSST
jgi:nitrate/nitrite transporter NarK